MARSWWRHPHDIAGFQILAAAVLIVLAVLLPLLRQAGTPSWRSIWAEDGSVYITQANLHGVEVIFRGYNGYLQLPARLLGAASTVAPTKYLAVFLALAGTVTYALLGWFCYWASEGWIASRVVRLVLAVLVVLMPALGPENTANITNTIWGFGAVAPWALISRSEQPLGLVARGAVLFLAATSTVLCMLLVPLALGIGLVRRSRGTWFVLGAFAVGLAIQGGVVLTTRYGGSIHPSVSFLAKSIGAWVFGVLAIGNDAVASLWRSHGGLLAVVATVLVTLILLSLLRGVGRRCQAMALVFGGYAVLTYAVSLWERGILSSGAVRYSVMPVLFLASALATAVSPKEQSEPRAWRPWAARAFAVWMIVLVALGFSVTNLRSVSPSWASSAGRTYSSMCRGATPKKLVAVPTTPKIFYGFSFSATVPCRDLSWSR